MSWPPGTSAPRGPGPAQTQNFLVSLVLARLPLCPTAKGRQLLSTVGQATARLPGVDVIDIVVQLVILEKLGEDSKRRELDKLKYQKSSRDG